MTKLNMAMARFAGGITLLGLSFFVACDNADSESFELTMPVSFIISEATTNSGGKDHEVTAELDLMQNPAMISYANQLEEVTFNHIEYTVSGATPEDIILNEATLSTSVGMAIVNGLNISLSNGTTGTFSLHAPGANDLESRLIGNEKDQLRLSGFLTRTPVTGTVTITFHLTITTRAR